MTDPALHAGPDAIAADELMWLNFDTRIRTKVQRMLMPIVDMSHDDRGRMITIEKHYDQFHNRLGKIEEAVFNKALNGEDTIFDKLAKRI